VPRLQPERTVPMTSAATTLEIHAPSLELPPSTTYEDWLKTGETLRTAKHHLDFMIGDWIAHGRVHFPEQVQPVLDGLGLDRRHLKRIERTVATFPAHLRDGKLSFEHHAHVADLPAAEALPLLKEAHRENLEAREFRIRAMLYKVESGRVLPREDDAEYEALAAFARLWNRHPVSVR